VTLLSPAPLLLPDLDDAGLSRAVQGGLRRLGVALHLGAAVAGLDGGAVTYTVKEAPETVTGDAVIDATGRVPNTEDLNLARAGVRVSDEGAITVDERGRTNIHHILAVGDVTPGPRLAHRAIAAGRVAAEAATGLPAALDPAVLPLAYFTEPEVAAAGLSERAARAAGYDALTARFPFAAAGRALTLGETDGFLQVVAEATGGRVLGVQIAGPDATELAGEAALAIEMTTTLEDLALTLHAHPTLSEAFVEAADLALGRPRHIFQRT
jgi:dihydrolipoamide dehydrogenase